MVVFGGLLGFSLSRIGFTDYGEVHRMFTFTDLRLFFTFAFAVAVCGVGFLALRHRQPASARPIHRGTIVGGLVFGVGWALTGACPGAALGQLGEGQYAALLSLGGIALGMLLYRRVHARFFRWDRGSCDQG